MTFNDCVENVPGCTCCLDDAQQIGFSFDMLALALYSADVAQMRAAMKETVRHE